MKIAIVNLVDNPNCDTNWKHMVNKSLVHVDDDVKNTLRIIRSTADGCYHGQHIITHAGSQYTFYDGASHIYRITKTAVFCRLIIGLEDNIIGIAERDSAPQSAINISRDWFNSLREDVGKCTGKAPQIVTIFHGSHKSIPPFTVDFHEYADACGIAKIEQLNEEYFVKIKTALSAVEIVSVQNLIAKKSASITPNVTSAVKELCMKDFVAEKKWR